MSWYASEVVKEYNNPFYEDNPIKYTFGSCLYIGWIATLTSLIAGCPMLCCHLAGDNEDDRGRYKPPRGGASAMPMATRPYNTGARKLTRDV